MMDIAGRRPLLLFPMLAMILDLALMTVCLILQVAHPLHSLNGISLIISQKLNASVTA